MLFMDAGRRPHRAASGAGIRRPLDGTLTRLSAASFCALEVASLHVPPSVSILDPGLVAAQLEDSEFGIGACCGRPWRADQCTSKHTAPDNVRVLSPGPPQYDNLLFQPALQALLLDLEVVPRLQV